MIKSEYFNMGQVVFTCTVLSRFRENTRFSGDIIKAVQQYSKMDWGVVDETAKKTNYKALSNPDDLYLFAAYRTCEGKIFIITARKTEIPGDNCTTVMFAHEY